MMTFPTGNKGRRDKHLAPKKSERDRMGFLQGIIRLEKRLKKSGYSAFSLYIIRFRGLAFKLEDGFQTNKEVPLES